MSMVRIIMPEQINDRYSYSYRFVLTVALEFNYSVFWLCLHWFDTFGWASGRVSGL